MIEKLDLIDHKIEAMNKFLLKKTCVQASLQDNNDVQSLNASNSSEKDLSDNDKKEVDDDEDDSSNDRDEIYGIRLRYNNFLVTLEFLKEIKKFLQLNHIPQYLFSEVCLKAPVRQMRYIFEKIERIINRKIKGDKINSGLSEAELTKLEDLVAWYKTPTERRLRDYEKMKKEYFESLNLHTEAEQAMHIRTLDVKHRSSKKKKVRFREPSRQQKVSLNTSLRSTNFAATRTSPSFKTKNSLSTMTDKRSLNMLKCYYNVNKYPNDAEYEVIAKECNLEKSQVEEFFISRHERFSYLRNFSREQYRSLVEFYFNVTTHPNEAQMKYLGESLNINSSYLRSWFSRQRTDVAELEQIKGKKIVFNEDVEDDIYKKKQHILELFYMQFGYPDPESVEAMSDKVGMSIEEIYKWYDNRESVDDEQDSENEANMTI